MEHIYEQFQNPGAEYRGKPFWSWNGKLEKEELLRQIHVMKEMGFGGFFMHSRTGLQTEYLGKEWFELINACAKEAEKLGMEAWLYDEDRWPSGTAGGMVTENPEYRMKYICLEVCRPSEFIWSDSLIAAFTCRLEGTNCYDCRRIFSDITAEELQNQTILAFSTLEMQKSSFYNGYTYLDTLNREATEKFIELTHEKYLLYSGDKFGSSIKGIFTDEPYRGALMDGFSTDHNRGEWLAPWTYKLFECFQEKYGYDLVPRLPELFLRPDGRSVSQVKWHYTELLMQLFLENFMKPVNRWCEEHNLILTGHILHEDSLSVQTSLCGSVMRCYEYMGYPGVDVLSEGNRSYWIVKQLSSAARQLGKKWLLSELYGCTGWQMSFESHKAVGDWQALFGINLRCHHLSWYTMEGEAKRDYPASILHQSAWWKEYRYVEDYYSRIGIAMSQGDACCDVLVINPVESLWCQVYAGWSRHLDVCSEEAKALDISYADLFHRLTGSHTDFDYGDEEMLSRLSSINTGTDGKPVLTVGRVEYRVVVVGGMTTIRSTTMRLLREFIKAGGKVVFAGDPPAYVDALQSAEAAEVAACAVCVPFDGGSVVSAVKKNVAIPVDIIDLTNGENISDINIRINKDNEIYYLFLLNTNREKGYSSVRIRLGIDGCAQEWDAASGGRYAAGEKGEDGFLVIDTSFEATGEKLYCVAAPNPLEPGTQENTGIPDKPAYTVKESFTIIPHADIELDEPNICVLDMASFKIEQGEWQEADEILNVDRVVRGHFGLALRGGQMLQPWYEGAVPQNAKGCVSLRFSFFMEELPARSLEMGIERPENFRIMVNGKAVHAGKPTGWWVDKCISRLPLDMDLFVIGENILELETDFHRNINLEAVYLLGGFGVRLDGYKKTICAMPRRVYLQDLTGQGLPFYGGRIVYTLEPGKKPDGDERFQLKLEGMAGACAKVVCPSGDPRMIAWRPYSADITDYIDEQDRVRIEVVLTRRNTFGPLHALPAIQPAYGPDSFITEGDSFSKSYVLLPSGILQTPVIDVLTLKV